MMRCLCSATPLPPHSPKALQGQPIYLNQPHLQHQSAGERLRHLPTRVTQQGNQSHSPAFRPAKNTWEASVSHRLSPLHPRQCGSTTELLQMSLARFANIKRRSAYSLSRGCAIVTGTLQCYREIGVSVALELAASQLLSVWGLGIARLGTGSLGDDAHDPSPWRHSFSADYSWLQLSIPWVL